MGLNPVCVDRQTSTFSSDFDGRVFLCSQDAEKIRQRRSRVVQTLNVPRGYASDLHSLRPCWTAFLSILLNVKRLDVMW
jgi:hypothetical protein